MSTRKRNSKIVSPADSIDDIDEITKINTRKNRKSDESNGEIAHMKRQSELESAQTKRPSEIEQSDTQKDRAKANRTTTKKVFVDAAQMKERIRLAAVKPRYSVCNFYHATGLFQDIARHQKFENVTLTIIAVNALWIAVDTDLNYSATLLEAHAVFQVAEHLFCLYFSIELFIRFMAFKTKIDGLKDAWFVFDSCLVTTMVLETWVMTIVLAIAGSGSGGGGMGNASLLRMARLLRLSRMARMARLFKAMPELLILIKAMAASLRSCSFVFTLMSGMLYVFGIAFRQLTAGTELEEKYFSNIFHAMYTLWIDGTLLDNTGSVALDLAHQHLVLAILFYVFILLSALTVMNMLIGVLCEVVSAVAATEKESLTVAWVKSRLQAILSETGLDENEDGSISKEELSKLLEFPEACKALADVGVDVFMLVDNIDFIFAADDAVEGEENEDDEKVLTFEEFMTLVLDLRGTNTATVKDIVELQKYIKRQNKRLGDQFKLNSTRQQSVMSRVSEHFNENSGEVYKIVPSDLPLSRSRQSSVSSSPDTIIDAVGGFAEDFTRDAAGVSRQETVISMCTIADLLTHIEALLQKSLIPELHKMCAQGRNADILEMQRLALQVGHDLQDRDVEMLTAGPELMDAKSHATNGGRSLAPLRHAGFANASSELWDHGLCKPPELEDSPSSHMARSRSQVAWSDNFEQRRTET